MITSQMEISVGYPLTYYPQVDNGWITDYPVHLLEGWVKRKHDDGDDDGANANSKRVSG